MDLSPTAHVDTFTRDQLPPQDLWPELFDLGYPERLNCAVELLDHAPDPTATCLLAPGLSWTYADLLGHANRLANLLVEDHGLVPGNRVLLRAPNNPWLVACWFAVLKAGGVAVTTMPLLRDHELRVIDEIARIDLTLVDDRFPCALRGVPFSELAEKCAGKSDKFVNVDTAADDVALLAFTSGTTGRPKATMHFHRDVLANADTFSRHILKPTAADVFAGSPPLGFTYGLGGLVVFPMRVGASTLLLEKGTPDLLLPALAEHGVTILFTAPTAYRAMLTQLPAGGLPALRRCVSAGEPLPLATFEAWEAATGLRLIDGIGATELLHIFISAADENIRPGATGLPVPGYVAAILDDTGAEVGPGVIGRLAVKGPTGCRYLADDRQQVYVQHGWNITGDTYLRDADGYYWYQARSDDMIISAGFNIAPPEVEWALLAHPDVLECAVVGTPDPERTMIVAAYVVLAPGVVGDDAKVAELREHCRREIASYKAPRTVEFIAALPRTSTGKVQRYLLR